MVDLDVLKERLEAVLKLPDISKEEKEVLINQFAIVQKYFLEIRTLSKTEDELNDKLEFQKRYKDGNPMDDWSVAVSQKEFSNTTKVFNSTVERVNSLTEDLDLTSQQLNELLLEYLTFT